MSGSSGQPLEFLIFFLAGCFSAVLYAVFRLFRRFVKQNGLFEIFLDLSFTVFSGTVFLFCLTQKTDGALKPFYFLAFFSALSACLMITRGFKNLCSRLFRKFKKNKKAVK